MTARFPLLDELTRDPLDPNKILAVAQYFVRAQEWGVAYHLLERAAQITQHPEILRQLGLTLLYLAAYAGDDDFIGAAEGVLMRGLELAPESPDLHRALAACALQLGRFDEAESLALMSLAAKPDQHDAQYTLALCAFYKGRWGEGFDLYDKHVNMPPHHRVLPREPQVPYWDGQPGTRLLVIGEQGIGDEISFASMIQDAARDNEVTLWCDTRLESLFRRSMPYARVEGHRHIATGVVMFGMQQHEYRHFDARCLSGTLGRYYRRTAGAFPRSGFLVADEWLRVAMRGRLDALPGKKVGIAWTGGKAPSYWHRRGLGAEDLRRLCALEGVSWVSLQYEAPDPQILRELGIHHFADVLEHQPSYEATAALVMELDAVVTVTTAMAHLCGALGKPAQVLVPSVPRWFYGAEGCEHPWYSALHLHRQVDGAWPIDAVRETLK